MRDRIHFRYVNSLIYHPTKSDRYRVFTSYTTDNILRTLKSYSQKFVLVFSLIAVSGCASSLESLIIRNKNDEALKLVKSEPGRINKKNSNGITPLVFSIRRGNEEMATSLLEAGADPNIAATSGNTPLTAASARGSTKLAKLLLKYGADADKTDNRGTTPLIIASFYNFYKLAKLLIEHGANVNKQNKSNTTPLEFSAWKGHTALTHLLLTHHADPNLHSKNSDPPLISAIRQGNITIVRDLIAWGANPDLLSKDKMTAKQIAEKNNSVAILALLNTDASQRPGLRWKNSHKPIFILKSVGGELNKKKIQSNWLRAEELRVATSHFLDLLTESGLFRSADTLDQDNMHDKDAVFATLDVQETEETESAGTRFTKGFFSGLLTLGLVPPSSNYGYKSEITMIVTLNNGKEKEYKAEADTTAKWQVDPRTSAYARESKNSKQAARKLVTHLALENLINQLDSDSSNFK